MEEEDFLGMDAFSSEDFPSYEGGDFESIFENATTEDEDTNDNDINETAEDENSESVGGDNEDNDEGSTEDDSSESSSNLYSSIAKVIHEQGLLPSLNPTEDKIDNIDDFVNAFKRESEVMAQTKLDDYIKNLDITKIAQQKSIINDLDTITDDVLSSNIDLAKEIIKQDYLNQGFDEARVNRLINRLTDLGDEAIIEDATESLGSVKLHAERQIEAERNAYDKKLEDQAKEQAKLDAQIKEHVFEKEALIEGLKPTKAMKDSVYKTMTEIVGKSPNGQLENAFLRDRRENPLEFETRMYYMYTLTNGFKDFGKLTNTSKSSAVNELEKAFKGARPTNDGLPSWMNDSDSYSGSGFTLNI